MGILRVNMTDQSIKSESMPDEYKFLGGRGLTSTIINSEVAAKSEALGLANKLVFAPGYLTATPLINTGRLSIGAKSPLTVGIKESNVGGAVAYALGRIGIQAVIVEGAADGCFLLKIDKDGSASLINAQNILKD